MKTIFRNSDSKLIRKIRKVTEKVLLSSFAFVVIASFIFSSPNPLFHQNLIKIEIAKIKTQNEQITKLPPLPVVDVSTTNVSANFASPLDSGDTGIKVAFAQEVVGCMDPNANNYNSSATVADTCTYDVVGCMDSSAKNYDPSANVSGSCYYDIVGCMDSSANDYDPTATVSGQCTYDIYGCTDSTASNYNSSATVDNATCEYKVYGCTDPTAKNYNPFATDDNGTCESSVVYGCMDTTALNYDPSATTDDGTCRYKDCSTDNSCTKTPICCGQGTEDALNHQGPPGIDQQCDPSVCTYTYVCCQPGYQNSVTSAAYGERCGGQCIPTEPTPVCCNSAYDNAQASAGTNEVCKYDPPTCQNVTVTTCTIHTAYSIIKSGIDIAGTADMEALYPCDGTGTTYLAGLAAAEVTPDTPLNTTENGGSNTWPFTYIVASKDGCLNVEGVQSIASTNGYVSGYDRSTNGFCCENPSKVNDPYNANSCVQSDYAAVCGSAVLSGSYEQAPSQNSLCANSSSSPSVIPEATSTTQTSYSWTCSNSVSTVACSVPRLCNGISCTACTANDCGTNDVCKNLPREQTANNFPTSLTSYPNGQCWNTLSGACGSLTYLPFVTASLTPSTANLCNTSNPASIATLTNSANTPTYNPNTNKWSWGCSSGGLSISPTCSVPMCQGAQCYPQTTGLIKSLKLTPSIVATTTDTCSVTWTTTIDSSNPNPVQGCTFYGPKRNALSNKDNNTTGLDVSPGSYSLTCYIGGSNPASETKEAKCSVKPAYKEI